MSQYIVKITRFFIVLHSLFLPSLFITAFADSNAATNNIYSPEAKEGNIGFQSDDPNQKLLVSNSNKGNNLEKTNPTSNLATENMLARSVQKMGGMLTSSHSDLAGQATSYALGTVNNFIASEAQTWLSQFGTAKIDFTFDKKGKLDKSSLDLLLPLYDNKKDWLFFSQSGYRKKDSRHTFNLGFGGRYFTPSWMYGLNSIFDYDITGNNRRLSLGGEIWGDYMKFSANTYWRLTGWRHSLDFDKHNERPANGYDINGEFFLPAYPSLGAKLAYEQYFGDEVTLFDRNTKQKNPSLGKIGVTYTPIPLVTMGVDYKLGTSGHSEAQFLANLNYRLGVPFSLQLSPANVDSMRTLAGSRYDLVERNNNIVLDHQKIAPPQLSTGPTNISLTLSNPTRTIFQPYTVTAIVRDKAGNIQVGRRVNWALKHFGQLGVKLIPLTNVTNNKGEVSALVNSSIPYPYDDDKNSNPYQKDNVTLLAYVDEDKDAAASVDMQFQLPKIEKIKASPENGTVPANAVAFYTFETKVTNQDGTPYSMGNLQWTTNNKDTNSLVKIIGSPSDFHPDGTARIKLAYAKNNSDDSDDSDDNVNSVNSVNSISLKACLAVIHFNYTIGGVTYFGETCSEDINYKNPLDS
ncbi:inverse autotransporter beta domain-containing protein [Xenorhabdus hominickii]|uniref:Putative invasin n=1 Tax=Xenorhabdus hominickii TaxID=351679 RepID=A0A2G0Q948_XENHO|nr:inverse autotransporter beta domain-containing protein [Xenorhabdus hominickii]AOM41028.1 hypothetical protein A9255_10840 [Xenorhabdus hominickii]PHM55743.1 putative invasin [Xenorhabdus hominickii]